MIEKTFRLSNGFWHKFFPNSNKLFSPQNIPLEIWDIDKRAKESKWNPGVYGLENVVFSNNGDKFVIHGGWITSKAPKKSEFKIYETDTMNLIDEFFVADEKCTNPVFTNDDKHLIFGTWQGNIYNYCIDDKALTNQYSLPNHSFNLIHHGKHSEQLYIIGTRKATDSNKNPQDYIFEYNVATKNGNQIDVPVVGISGQPYTNIRGLTLHDDKLAIMTTYYGGKENERVVHEAKVYIYDTNSKEIKLVKENFKVRDVFKYCDCITWSNGGNKLAFIGLNEVYIIDIESNYEQAIPFERPSSVAFSNCDTGIAVGGNKAKLFKMP